MSTFRQIGARAKTQGGGSFTNMSVSNQIITAQPMTMVANTELVNNVAYMLENDTDFRSNLSDTVETNLVSKGPFVERVSDPVKVYVAQRLLSDATFTQNLSGPVKLLVASQLLEDDRASGFMASVQNQLQNNAGFIQTLTTPIQQAVADKLDGDPNFIYIIGSNLESNPTFLHNVELNLVEPLKTNVASLLVNDTGTGGFIPNILSELQDDSGFVSNLSEQVFGPSGTTGFIETIVTNLSDDIEGNTGLWDGWSAPVKVAVANIVAYQLIAQTGPTGFSSNVANQLFALSETTELTTVITNNLIQTVQTGTALWGQLSTPVQISLANTIATQLLAQTGPTGFANQLFGASGASGLVNSITTNITNTIQTGTGLWGQLSTPVQMSLANTIGTQLLAQTGPTGFANQLFGASGASGLVNSITTSITDTIQTGTGLWGQLSAPVQLSLANTIGTQLLAQTGSTGFSTQLFGATGASGLADSITTNITNTIQTGTALWGQLSTPVQISLANTIGNQLLAQTGPTGFSNQLFGASGASGLADSITTNITNTIQTGTGLWSQLSTPVQVSLANTIGNQLLAQTGPTGFSNQLFGASGASGLADSITTNIIDTIQTGTGLWSELSTPVQLLLANTIGTQLLAQTGSTGFTNQLFGASGASGLVNSITTSIIDTIQTGTGLWSELSTPVQESLANTIGSQLLAQTGPTGFTDTVTSNMITKIQSNTGVWNGLTPAVNSALASALSTNMGTQLFGPSGPSGLPSAISNTLFGSSGTTGFANTISTNVTNSLTNTIQTNPAFWYGFSSEIDTLINSKIILSFSHLNIVKTATFQLNTAEGLAYNNITVPLAVLTITPPCYAFFRMSPTVFKTNTNNNTCTSCKIVVYDATDLTTVYSTPFVTTSAGTNNVTASCEFNIQHATDIENKTIFVCAVFEFSDASTYAVQPDTGYIHYVFTDQIHLPNTPPSLPTFVFPMRISATNSILKIYNSTDTTSTFSATTTNTTLSGVALLSTNTFSNAAWFSIGNSTSTEFSKNKFNEVFLLNVYIASSVSVSNTNFPASTITITRKGPSSNEIALSKVNAVGVPQWSAVISNNGTNFLSSYTIIADDERNVFVHVNNPVQGNVLTAYNSNGTSYSPPIDNSPAITSAYNTIIVKYDSNGYVLGFMTVRANSVITNPYVYDIYYDSFSKSILFTLSNNAFSSTLTINNFNNNTLTLPASGTIAHYVIKLNNIGYTNVQKYFAFSIKSGVTYVFNVCTDTIGNMYSTIYNGGSSVANDTFNIYDGVEFSQPLGEPSIIVANLYTNVRTYTLVKHNNMGQAQWGVTITTQSNSNLVIIKTLCADAKGNVYFAFYTNETSFDVKDTSVPTPPDLVLSPVTINLPSGYTGCSALLQFNSDGVFQGYCLFNKSIVNKINFWSNGVYVNFARVTYPIDVTGSNVTTPITLGTSTKVGHYMVRVDPNLTPTIVGYAST